jgi:hypothetical protein
MKKIRTVSATVLTTAAVIAGAAAVAGRQQTAKARQAYIDETSSLLIQGIEQIHFAQQLDPDFQPKFQRLLGQLETVQPPPEFVKRHGELVESLDSLGREYDAVLQKAASGDIAGLKLGIQKLNSNWARVLRSHLDWLESVRGNVDEFD